MHFCLLNTRIFIEFSQLHFRNGARFSVRASGVEIVGRSENLKDLLSEQASGK